MKLKVETYTIEIHRAEETSHKEEVQRLATYVSTICDIGMSINEVEDGRK